MHVVDCSSFAVAFDFTMGNVLQCQEIAPTLELLEYIHSLNERYSNNNTNRNIQKNNKNFHIFTWAKVFS